MSQNKKLVSELVTKFNHNFDEYKNPIFNETQVRIEFVNPFWKSLGWDLDNESGNSLSYRDVVHEDSLKIGRTTKAPQAPRYTSYKRLIKAKNLDEVF